MDRDKLHAVLEGHRGWLTGTPRAQRADLQRADLQQADLQRADLRVADLQGADLRVANLREADLRGADLRGANLRVANLRGADLRVADLREANLREANLQGANLDFSAWPLSCGSLQAKADERLVAQLLFHVARLDVSGASEWAQGAVKAVALYADKFCEYRADVELLELKEEADADSE